MPIVSTRFTTSPRVYRDTVTHRVMVASSEMHETFVQEEGRWREGAFDDGDLRENFVLVQDQQEAWRVFKQALGQVGYL